MRFKELFNPKRSISNLGAFGFKLDIMKEQVRTPHFEMQKGIEMLQRRPIVNSGMRQLTRLVIGNNLSIISDDEQTQEFLNTWIDQRKTIINEITTTAMLGISLGNAYLEPTLKQRTNGEWILDNAWTVSDPSRIYINPEAKDLNEYWLYSVPLDATSYKDQKPRYWKVSYVKGSSLITEQIWAIPIHKDKLWRWKVGWSPDGWYGRGVLASSIDDEEVIHQIIRNYAIIAKNRSIGRKIISITNPDDSPSDQADVDDLKDQFDQVADDEHIMINKKFQQEDLTFVGMNDAMDQQLDFLRKELNSGLVPNYLTPWNSEVNRATANEVKVVLQLELENIRQEFVQFLNNTILNSLLNSYPHLKKEGTTFSVGDIDLDSKEERMNWATQLFQSSVITLNELREVAGYKRVPGGDKFINDLTVNPGSILDDMSSGVIGEKACSHDNQPFREAFTDDDWNKKTKRKFTVVRKKVVGGKGVRLVKDKQGNWIIYEGLIPLKEFESDEREVAEKFMDVHVKRLEKIQDEFEEGDDETDKIVNDLFKQIKKAHAEIVDDLFKDVGRSKASRESFKEAILDKSILGRVDSLFQRFNDKINDIVAGVLPKLTKAVLGADIVPDTPGETNNIKDLSKMLLQDRTAAQIKSFNDASKATVQRTLSDGIAAGKTIAQIKRDLKDNIDKKKTKENPQDSDISRIVRTEINSNVNLLRLRNWEEQGFEFFEWITKSDDRVREAHRKRNRRIFKIKDALDGKIIFPGGSLNNNAPDAPNINCRCRAELWG